MPLVREPAWPHDPAATDPSRTWMETLATAVAFEMIAIGHDWDRTARRDADVGANPAWAQVIRTGLLPESA